METHELAAVQRLAGLDRLTFARRIGASEEQLKTWTTSDPEAIPQEMNERAERTLEERTGTRNLYRAILQRFHELGFVAQEAGRGDVASARFKDSALKVQVHEDGIELARDNAMLPGIYDLADYDEAANVLREILNGTQNPAEIERAWVARHRRPLA